MPFTNPDFPNQVFQTVAELKEAQEKRQQIEKELESRAGEITRVTATVIPAPPSVLEKRIAELEEKLAQATRQLGDPSQPSENKDGLPIGMVLQGESKGQRYTLEVLEEGYLCSTGHIEPTLSAAAEKVSGNRRSGWAFWRDGYNTPVGEITGRFSKREVTDPFGAIGV